MSLGATRSAPAAAWESRGFHEQLDAFVVQDVEMVAIHPGDAAVPVAHVFAEANVGDDEQVGTFRLDRADCLLHDAILRIGAGSALVLFVRQAEKEDSAEPGLRGADGFAGDLVRRDLLDPGHAADGAAALDFLANEKRKDEIVRREDGLAHEVAQRGGAAQTARAVNQFPHGPRLRACLQRRKLPGSARAAKRGPACSHSRGDTPCSAPPEGGVRSGCAAARGGVCLRPLKRATDYLLIDVSNSFTKFAFASTKKLGATERTRDAHPLRERR